MLDTPTPVPARRPPAHLPGPTGSRPEFAGMPLLGNSTEGAIQQVRRILEKGVTDPATRMQYRVYLAGEARESALAQHISESRARNLNEFELMRNARAGGLVTLFSATDAVMLVRSCMERGVTDTTTGMHFRVSYGERVTEKDLVCHVFSNRTGNDTDYELIKRACRDRKVSLTLMPGGTMKPNAPPEHPTEFRHGRK